MLNRENRIICQSQKGMKTADAEDFQASLNNLFMVSYCLKIRLIVKSAVRMTYGFFLFCYQYFIAKDEENVSEKKC